MVLKRYYGLICVAAHLLPPVFGYNLLTSFEQLDPNKEYDYIIAGGGTAGSVLAARLSEDPDVSVLVVEAGGRVEDVPTIAIPFLGVTLPGTAVDWNYSTVSQEGFGGRDIPFARGHVLGGTSCINLLTFHRGSNDMWDNWANITGDDCLSWKSIEPYYLRNSRLVPPADGHDTTGEADPLAHGFGPVEVSNPGYPYELDSHVVEASKNLGSGKFRYNMDLNAGEALGLSYMQSAVGDGKRSCASTAYLSPIEGSRENLDVLINTQVTKLVNTACPGDTPDLRIVQLGNPLTTSRIFVKATKEVIVSAGVVGTPKILKLSGVGPKPELESLGIEALVDLPDVGLRLQDHPLVPLYFRLNTNSSFDDLLRNETLFGEAMAQWQSSGKGPFVISPANTVGYIRLESGSPALEGMEDPANGPHSAHLELIFSDGFAHFSSLEQPATGSYTSILVGLMSPLSEGKITLTSNDPFASPTIDPNYMNYSFDKAAVLQGMKDVFEFITTSPLAGFVAEPLGELATADSDAKLLAYALATGVTENHGCGTARMTTKGADGGVIDPEFRVKGVHGVTIVDASIFPTIPNVHIQAPVYILAERAADVIKERHL